MHKHIWEKEMFIKSPGFIGRWLFGDRPKMVWYDGYFICKCGARKLETGGLSFVGDNNSVGITEK